MDWEESGLQAEGSQRRLIEVLESIFDMQYGFRNMY